MSISSPSVKRQRTVDLKQAAAEASSAGRACGKCLFVDMKHSNNAARIRLWRDMKPGMADAIERLVVTYADLKKPEFAKLNPLKKVPALVCADGSTVFESAVILGYLEDVHSAVAPSFTPPTPEGRRQMALLMRIHDLYIASPNCCAPGFSHSQGSMYLSYGFHGAARGMDLPTREAKLSEIWQQLCWLEEQVANAHAACGEGCLLGGTDLTLADFTWFPTCVFMEFMLPRVFSWADPFAVGECNGKVTPFPALASWYTSMRTRHAPFATCRSDIWDFWEEMEAKGQFQHIRNEITSAQAAGERDYKWVYGVPTRLNLNYQTPPPAGKVTGRYINQPPKDDVVDEMAPAPVWMRDARELSPAATLEAKGFELRECPTDVADFTNDEEVKRVYYGEMRSLVKRASGASHVVIFDHTLRKSTNANLNAQAGGSAAPVPRVHCDYTHEGAPRRLSSLAKQGLVTADGEALSEEDAKKLAEGRYAFINVWRSIDPAAPVMQKPLAVCDEASVHPDDKFLYELRFPDRTGENYSLKHSDAHRWYYYPRMRYEECLLFKVFDKHEDGTRFVFHTAFDEPDTPPDAPPRSSIEVRSIAFFA